MPKSPLAVALPFPHFHDKRSLAGSARLVIVRIAPFDTNGFLQPARGASPQSPLPPGVGLGVGPIGVTVGVAVGSGSTIVGVAIGIGNDAIVIATVPGRSAALAP